MTLTRRLIDLARARGFRINTPEADAERGGSVIIDVPNGAEVAEELIRREIIVDYRPGAGIRMAPHFYNTIGEIDHAMEVLDDIVCGSEVPPGSRVPHSGSRIPRPGSRSPHHGSRIPPPGSRFDP